MTAGTTTATLALKEWGAVVHALLDGRQTQLLRKGGIHEKTFDTALAEGSDPFVIFPTVAHSHRERVRPEHHDVLDLGARDVDDDAGTLTIRCGVRLVAAITVVRPQALHAVADLHIWTSESVAERVDFRPRHPLHALVVGAVALPQPVTVPRLQAYGGCRSWVEVPLARDRLRRSARARGRASRRRRRARPPGRRVTTRSTVRGLWLSLHPVRAPYAAVAGRWRPNAWSGGAGSPLRLRTMAQPVLPSPEWVRIRVGLGGICASDLKLLRLTAYSPMLAAWADWRSPVVPGHEVVGTVTETGPAAGLAEGDRVVAEPLLSCRDKQLSPCAACRHGDDHVCARAADVGGLCKGNGFGFNARFGGGWAQELVAPGWRCARVPPAATDADAVLAEPLAIALHAVARHPPGAGSKVLVIGPGTIGLCIVMALRVLTPQVEVAVAGIDHFTDDRFRDLGVEHVLHGTRTMLVEQAAAITGGALRRPPVGRPVVDGGFDAVFDCVGSEQTIDDALRTTRARGQLVLVATSGRQRVDWSLVWWRELRIAGTVFYAREPGGRRALAMSAELLPELRPGVLVTHRFPLEDAPVALQTAAAGPRAEAIKVAFAPNG